MGLVLVLMFQSSYNFEKLTSGKRRNIAVGQSLFSFPEWFSKGARKNVKLRKRNTDYADKTSLTR